MRLRINQSCEEEIKSFPLQFTSPNSRHSGPLSYMESSSITLLYSMELNSPHNFIQGVDAGILINYKETYYCLIFSGNIL